MGGRYNKLAERMSNVFNQWGDGGDVNLSNGSVDIVAKSLSANSLQPNLPLKTDGSRQLYSTKLALSDIQGLGDVITNPYIGTLQATDLETSEYFSVNTELQKVDNFTASTPNQTHLAGTLNVEYLSTRSISDPTNASFIQIDQTAIYLSANTVSVNGVPIVTTPSVPLVAGAGITLVTSPTDITVTNSLPFSATNATDLAAIVRPLLSPRGTVAVDPRTNTLIIRDVRGSGALTTP